jgi:hypothetical protein
VVRAWRAVAVSTVVLIAAGCASSVPAAKPGYSVPISRIIADANAQNRSQHAAFRLAPAGTVAPLSEAAATRVVITGCNEGRGTRVLVAGLVTGPVEAGSPLYWAVFVDPPGKHIAPYSQPVNKPAILNWIGGFVPVKQSNEPFCDFGHAADLPPLPVFGS